MLWLVDKIMKLLGKIQWEGIYAKYNQGRSFDLMYSDWFVINSILRENYCIILTWRKSHLSSYLVSLGSFLTRGKFAKYSHALMNLEDDVFGFSDFRLIEATGNGIGYSSFVDVFNCDRVCLLRPRGITLHEWTKVMDGLKAQHGKDYDTLLSFKDTKKLSCTELVWMGLKQIPNYEEKLGGFYKDVVLKRGKILPDDFLDYFEVVFKN